MAGMHALFEPLRLGGIALANRNAVSPMCQYSAENGAANDWHLQHLGSLSLSGAGLVIVEQTAVEPVGRISHGCLGLSSDETSRRWPPLWTRRNRNWQFHQQPGTLCFKEHEVTVQRRQGEPATGPG